MGGKEAVGSTGALPHLGWRSQGWHVVREVEAKALCHLGVSLYLPDGSLGRASSDSKTHPSRVLISRVITPIAFPTPPI